MKEVLFILNSRERDYVKDIKEMEELTHYYVQL